MHSGAKASSPRKLVWVATDNSAAWGCSQCDWFFLPVPIAVNSFHLMANYLREQLDHVFASHDCAKNPAKAGDRTVHLLRQARRSPVFKATTQKERDERFGTDS